MRNTNLDQPLTAIVTGASTGIGYAITRRFLDQGFNVVMNARTRADLEAAYESLGSPTNAVYRVGDIADKALGLGINCSSSMSQTNERLRKRLASKINIYPNKAKT